METYVVGIKVPDDSKWVLMNKIYNGCKLLAITIPQEVIDFFDGKEPDDTLDVPIPHSEYEEDMKEGIEIKVTDIPDSVDVIRFYNSW